MITPFDADDDDEEEEQEQETAAAKTGQGKGEIPAQPDQSLNEVLSTELQRDFASRIAMESQLGDTLKSRLITVFLHFSYGIHFLFFFFYRLRISNAQTTDTGNYTCQPTTASSASVMVHVINGKLTCSPHAVHKQFTYSTQSINMHKQCILCTVHTLYIP